MMRKYYQKRFGRDFDPRTTARVEETRDLEFNEKGEIEKFAKRFREKRTKKNA